jgi:5-methylcytosine-specific restriction protein A
MRRRPRREEWHEIRSQVWQRDGGMCQHCHCAVALDKFHCDHIQPVVERGKHHLDNLRVLCRCCHVLRASNTHRGMMAKALKDGIIPADWRGLVWE